MLNDDALTILCTDFKIGVYTSKSCLCKQRSLGEALVAERQCGETKCRLQNRGIYIQILPVQTAIFGGGISRGATMRRNEVQTSKSGYIHPNLACKNGDFWERALVAERQCGETKCSLDSAPRSGNAVACDLYFFSKRVHKKHLIYSSNTDFTASR